MPSSGCSAGVGVETNRVGLDKPLNLCRQCTGDAGSPRAIWAGHSCGVVVYVAVISHASRTIARQHRLCQFVGRKYLQSQPSVFSQRDITSSHQRQVVYGDRRERNRSCIYLGEHF